MEFKILENKPIVINSKDNQEIVDLIYPSMRYENTNYNIVDYFYVGEDMIMRPDLLSYITYNNINSWDKLLKFNGISNPFSIDQGDLILVPDLFWIENQVVKSDDNNKNNYKINDAVDPTKKISKSKAKVEYDEYVKKMLAINKNIVLNVNDSTPNMAKPGEGEIKIEGNKIILG